jgi:hypothetical protein
MTVWERMFGGVLSLERVFDAISPLSTHRLLSPRLEITEQIMNSLRHPGAQLLVVGEEKCGKTTIISRCLDDHRMECGVKFDRISYIEKMTSSELAGTALRKLRATQTLRASRSESRGYNKRSELRIGPFGEHFGESDKSTAKTTDSYLGEEPALIQLAAALQDAGRILFIDDLKDKILDDVVSWIRILARLMSDQLRDPREPASKLIIAVRAVDVSAIWRAFCQDSNGLEIIRVPRMSDSEIDRLVRFGCKVACLNLDEDVIERLVMEADGMPSLAKQLCLRIGCLVALNSGRHDHRLKGNESLVTEGWLKQNDFVWSAEPSAIGAPEN